MNWAYLSIGVVAALVGVSYLIEAARRSPTPPETLAWAPDIPIRYVKAEDVRIRWIVVGTGRPVVLLHTLRTQLDMFRGVVPELAVNCRVYALDLPAHGFSDIPNTEYTPEFFVASVGAFLDELDITDAVLAGESIGGTIALLQAARHNPRVRAVVAVNPYDYDAGRGIRRSSALANVIFGVNNVPVLGSTVARLRQHFVVKRILQGGVFSRDSLPDSLETEMYQVGNRRGHYQAFISLVRHFPEWERARDEYSEIECPVTLVYGDHDWSRENERDTAHELIRGSSLRVVPNAGHFLSLDAPRAFADAVARVAGP
jgi:pimeloyl-ACP methyl ester carboxylesterase